MPIINKILSLGRSMLLKMYRLFKPQYFQCVVNHKSCTKKQYQNTKENKSNERQVRIIFGWSKALGCYTIMMLTILNSKGHLVIHFEKFRFYHWWKAYRPLEDVSNAAHFCKYFNSFWTFIQLLTHFVFQKVISCLCCPRTFRSVKPITYKKDPFRLTSSDIIIGWDLLLFVIRWIIFPVYCNLSSLKHSVTVKLS